MTKAFGEHMDQPMKTPIKDLAQNARKHYEEASTAIAHRSSVIPKAIDAWELQERANTRLHLTAFGVRIDLFIRIGGGR